MTATSALISRTSVKREERARLIHRNDGCGFFMRNALPANTVAAIRREIAAEGIRLRHIGAWGLLHRGWLCW